MIEKPVQDPRPPPAITPRTPGDWWRAILPAAVATIVSIVIICLFSRYREQIRDMKEYGYVGAFVVGLLGNATVILPAPSLAFTTALGITLNPIFVGLAAGLGEALGELTGYLAGVGGKAIVENQARYRWVQSHTDRYGGAFFFFLAAIPNPLFDIAGIVAGVMRYPVFRFLLAVWAGKTLKAILFAGAGRHLIK